MTVEMCEIKERIARRSVDAYWVFEQMNLHVKQNKCFTDKKDEQIEALEQRVKALEDKNQALGFAVQGKNQEIATMLYRIKALTTSSEQT